jgi:hypothetical protein
MSQDKENQNNLVVIVYIDYSSRGSAEPVWYFNGFTGSDLRIRVPKRFSGIEFKLDVAHTARKDFIFASPQVRRNRKSQAEGAEYPDLTPPVGFNHGASFIVTDSHENSDHIVVGAINLRVVPLDSLGEPDESRAIWFDPEVLNDGQSNDGGPM